MIVPGSVGYSCNKVAVAGTDVKYQFCLKGCDLILFSLNKLLPSRFKLTDPLLWQQLRDELQRTKQSKIKWNRQQSNPANWVSDVRRTDPWSACFMLMHPAADLDAFWKHVQKPGQVTTCISRLNFHFQREQKPHLPNKWTVAGAQCRRASLFIREHKCVSIWAPSILHCNKYARCSATLVSILFVAA